MAIVFATKTSDGSSLTIRFVRGTRWQDTITLTDEVTGAPIDLTGVSDVLLRIRRTTISTAVLKELSVTNGLLVVSDAEAGEITIDVPSLDTNDFPANGYKRAKYVYDLMIQRSAEEWEAGISGKVIVDPSVSRPLDDA